MERELLLERLNGELRERHAWVRNPDGNSMYVTVGDMTLRVDHLRTTPLWRVQHERFGVLSEWTPAASVQEAIHHCCDFSRAHMLGVAKEQTV